MPSHRGQENLSTTLQYASRRSSFVCSQPPPQRSHQLPSPAETLQPHDGPRLSPRGLHMVGEEVQNVLSEVYSLPVDLGLFRGCDNSDVAITPTGGPNGDIRTSCSGNPETGEKGQTHGGRRAV